jgi:hypothetical protein
MNEFPDGIRNLRLRNMAGAFPETSGFSDGRVPVAPPLVSFYATIEESAALVQRSL